MQSESIEENQTLSDLSIVTRHVLPGPSSKLVKRLRSQESNIPKPTRESLRQTAPIFIN